MTRQTTFSFTLDPTPEQRAALGRHVGAARFAFNQCLRLVLNALEAKKGQPEGRVPWSGFDLINAFNAWKRSAEAGSTQRENPGSPGVTRSASRSTRRPRSTSVGALEALSAWRRGERKGKRPNMPRFKKKPTARRSFRLRNKAAGTKSAIRLGEGLARSVRLPKSARSRSASARASSGACWTKAGQKSGSHRQPRAFGHWRVTLNVEASLSSAACHEPNQHPRVVGIDRGLASFAVLADRDGQELERLESPRPLRQALPALKRRSRALSRKQKGSRNRFRARSGTKGFTSASPTS